jgi:hypothetical protein
MAAQNKFIIIREDLVQDPVIVISDGLLIGRLHECEVRLNHPAVSRVQAGIKPVEGEYFIFNLRPSNPALINGRIIEENEALGAGDVIEAGPFLLEIDRTPEALIIKVSLQIGRTPHLTDVSDPLMATVKMEDADQLERMKKEAKRPPKPAPLPATKALDIFWDKRIKEAGKMVRPSPLFPHSARRSGKTQFNWISTTDLMRHWPGSFFFWGAVLVAIVSAAGAYWYAEAFSPGPVAKVHTSSKLTTSPPIAARPNANSCTSCHSLTGTMEQRCASCHNASGFKSTMIEPHVAAGIGCLNCHDEHKGDGFRAAGAALATCTACHNNANKATYNGKQVSTPHGGTFGYPVVDTRWTWKGLSDSDWALKKIPVVRLPTDDQQRWVSKQFHAIHQLRVRAIGGIGGNTSGQLSCSSCHKSFTPIDRVTPRRTCGVCHNGSVDQATGQTMIASDKPNCISCHVQHVQDKKHWNPSLMAVKPAGA